MNCGNLNMAGAPIQVVKSWYRGHLWNRGASILRGRRTCREAAANSWASEVDTLTVKTKVGRVCTEFERFCSIIVVVIVIIWL